MQIGCLDIGARNGCDDLGLPSLCGGPEDAVRCVSADVEIVVVGVSCRGIELGVGARERPFEVGVQVALPGYSYGLQCIGIDLDGV